MSKVGIHFFSFDVIQVIMIFFKIFGYLTIFEASLLSIESQ